MEIGTPPVGERRRKARHRAVPLLPEVRHFKATGLEIRAESRTDEIVITGSPVVYETEYEVWDAIGPFSERMDPGVATSVLGRGVDCRFLLNHDGLPLARSTSGTLTLIDTPTALTFTARLDARQQLANDLAVAIERGDVSQMSCGFCVSRDSWDEDMEHRTIHEFSDLLDISAVTYPASPTTSIQIAHRMAMEVPVESRARLRRTYTDLRAGKSLAPDRVEALRALLDPSDEVEPDEAPVAEVREDVTREDTRAEPRSDRTAPATEAERREQSMSFGDRQSAVYAAVCGQYGTQTQGGYFDLWICDMGDDWVVWQDYVANTLQRLSYVIDSDGNVTLVGDPQPVAQHTIYKPVDQPTSRGTLLRVKLATRRLS